MIRFYSALAFIVLAYFPCYISNELLTELTQEDGFYEWLGAILFLFTSIAFVLLASKPSLFNQKIISEKYGQRIYFVLFAILFFVAFGEEISWGQRVFNFATPEKLKEMNIQDEFNLHNLEVFHGKTTEGEDKKGLMALLTMHRLFYLTFLTYLLLIPFLYAKISWFRNFIQKIRLPVPNIMLGVLFAFNLVYGNIIRAVNSEIDGHGTVEIKEFVIAFVLFGLPLLWTNFKRKKGV